MAFRQSSAGTYHNPLFPHAQRKSWVRRHPRWAVFLGVLFLGGLLYVMYGLPNWRLTTLTVEGTYTLSIDELRDITVRQMRGRWLFFFRQDKLWAFDTSAYEQRLRERWIFSELRIYRTPSGTLRLILNEEKPAFRYTSGTQTFGIDRHGVASTLTTTVTDTDIQLTLAAPPAEVHIGDQLITQPDAQFLQQWVDALRARSQKDLRLQEVVLAAAPDRTVRLVVAGDWEIRTDRTQSVQTQIAAFFVAYDQKLQGRTLDYVDVTVPSRVYYK